MSNARRSHRLHNMPLFSVRADSPSSLTELGLFTRAVLAFSERRGAGAPIKEGAMRHSTRWVQWVLAFGVSVLLLGIGASVAVAESYIQVSAGMVGPSPWQEWRSEYATAGQATEQDLHLNSGWAVGAKAGYWGVSMPWLGIELDYTGARHDLRGANHRHITYTHDPRGGAEYGIDAAQYIVHAAGINLVVRYPGEIWQPYAGIGPALFGGVQGGSPMNIQGGWNVEAGLRANLTQHLYATIEAKYQQVRAFHTEPTGINGTENGQSALLSRPLVLAGIGWAF